MRLRLLLLAAILLLILKAEKGRAAVHGNAARVSLLRLWLDLGTWSQPQPTWGTTSDACQWPGQFSHVGVFAFTFTGFTLNVS
jgi:hypothetical protein